MILMAVGTATNLVGALSSAVIAYFSFKLGRWGNKRAYLLSIGSLLISLGLLIYSFIFLRLVVGTLPYNSSLLLLFGKYASFFILVGFFLLVCSYTIQSLQTPFQTTPFLAPIILLGMVEMMSTLLTLYLLLLIAYNTGKQGGRVGPLTVFSFFLLFTAQMIITAGFILPYIPFFFLGATIRGFAFLPLLIVTIKSTKR